MTAGILLPPRGLLIPGRELLLPRGLPIPGRVMWGGRWPREMRSVIGRALGFMGGVAPDPYFSSVSLLLHGDGADSGTTFTDSSSHAKSATVNGTIITSTTQIKFGSASIKLVGTSDSLTYSASDTDFEFGTGPGTFEWWMRVPSDATTSLGNIYSSGSGASDFIMTSGTSGIGGTLHKLNVWPTGLSSTTTVDDSAWHFVAITFTGSNAHVYVDGTREATGSFSTSMGTSAAPAVGAGYHGCIAGGYIDDFRVTKGVARYTGSTCPVPTGPFPDF